MKITHHPDPSTLMSYAAGSLPSALAAVVSVHLAMCRTCRQQVQELDAVGASLIEALDASGPSRTTTPSALRIHASEPRQNQQSSDPIEALVGSRLEDIKWKRLGLGVWHYPIVLGENDKGDLRLLKVAPNQAMPEHGHGGCELTLLLDGAYDDEVGRFTVGDIADLDDTIEHRPVADREMGCVCLIASERPAHFRGFIARLMQPLAGL